MNHRNYHTPTLFQRATEFIMDVLLKIVLTVYRTQSHSSQMACTNCFYLP